MGDSFFRCRGPRPKNKKARTARSGLFDPLPERLVFSGFEFGSVAITGHPEHTAAYEWGDRTLRTIHCRTCGCVTHWEPLVPEAGARHGVNLGNFDRALIASVRVRRFDGADTWAFLD